MNKMDHSSRTIQLGQSLQGLPISVAVTKGEHWSQRMKAGPLIFNILPQIVIWAEDNEGQLIKTLYITGAGGKGTRHAGKDKKGAAFYAECFPVWALRLKAAGRELPSKEKPYPDAVTSATPMSSFTVQTRLPDPGQPFALFAEVNKSADNNGTFTEENNDWAGQPSLIYKVMIPEIEKGHPYEMEVIGHGGRIKDKPAVYADLSGFDTALKQLHEIKISFE
jgi:hypothetical protein